MDLRSKARGALLGAALGDALGRSFEGHPAPAASEVSDVLRAHATLRYTDDTAMTIALAESLVAVGDLDEDHLAETFARHWHAEPWRGYGRGTASLLRVIHGGGSWRVLAPAQFDGGSYGNGAAMRVAPVTLLAGGDIPRTLDLARRSAQVTHAHPLGIDGAALQAGVLALALASPADEPLDRQAVLSAAGGFVTEAATQQQLERVAELAAHALPAEVATRIGHGVDAPSSVPAALAAGLLAGGSMSDAIRYAIAIGGDTDTIASMAAAITGAHLGAEAIPGAWLTHLEGRERLISLADGLVGQGASSAG
jgi:poly(ADP-ribose) glycohydrolase ARH3